jgi:hypothetical protein
MLLQNAKSIKYSQLFSKASAALQDHRRRNKQTKTNPIVGVFVT